MKYKQKEENHDFEKVVVLMKIFFGILIFLIFSSIFHTYQSVYLYEWFDEKRTLLLWHVVLVINIFYGSKINFNFFEKGEE